MTAMRFDLPTPDNETQPFWDGTREGKLLIKKCNACGEFHFYPRPFCPKCWSDDVEWYEASGKATLYTWSVVHRNDLPPFPEAASVRLPMVVATADVKAVAVASATGAKVSERSHELELFDHARAAGQHEKIHVQFKS